MKKSIVLAILGIAGAVGTTAYGQGSVVFKNYFTSSSPTINFNATGVTPASKEGLAVGSSLDAQLLWYNGVTGNASLLTAVGAPVVFGTSVTSVSPVADGDLADGAGYFIGNVIILPGYTSGLATFEVDVYGTEGANTYGGMSALFTMTPATGASPPPGFNQVQVGVGSIQYNPGSYTIINSVPEPATMALGGLGLAAMMLIRRKKA
jgi:hypothetical protein